MAVGARDILTIVRKGIDIRAVNAHVRKPFRFLLCGDLSLIGELRSLLLSGHDGAIPLDAAACLETLPANGPAVTVRGDARAVIFLGRRGDAAAADFVPLQALNVPILALTVDPERPASGPPAAPAAGTWAEYVVPAISRETLRTRFFPHLVDCSKGVEIAVGRRLPVMRESVAAKLTRDAASSALKIALASAVVDHVPLFGFVLGAFASAGDMVAITGIQVMLMLHIEAAYGRDADMHRLWELLPVIGGAFGWRALAREASGFLPVAGIAIKGAIAYAGTIVVGEGVTFLLQNGQQMSAKEAAQIYERTKNDALRFARELIAKLRS